MLFVAAVILATASPAELPSAEPSLSPSDVTATMQRVAAYYVQHAGTADLARCGWEHGAFLQGVMATYRATGNASWLAHARHWAEQNRWTTCNYPKVLEEHAAANDMSSGQTYAELYMAVNATSGGQQRNDTWLHSIRDDVLEKLVLRPAVDDWWWCDAYFMAMGTFARVGHISTLNGHNGDRFHDKNLALFNDSAVRRGLWSAGDALFFRDETYKNQTSEHGAHVYWGRGNGWAAGALARTLQYTPRSHPAWGTYAALSRRSGFAPFTPSGALDPGVAAPFEPGPRPSSPIISSA